MKRIISFILALIFALIMLIPFSAYATDVHSQDIELRADQLASDAYKFIENSLKYAKNNANDKNPITITLPSGTYYLSKCLHIYSNTNLVLQKDTVIIKDFEDGNMLKCGIKDEKNSGYNGYRNISVSGGIWDEAFNGDSCGMRFAHCSNVSLKNVTIKNNKNSHHIELASAENFSIINCTFSGYKRTNSSDGMAVQIDTMHYYSHFPDYYNYDDTPCRNITVKGCTFDNVYAGVGPYSGVIGSYFDKIVIKSNTFKNIKDKAISAFNYVNSTIYNNNIDGATIGILFEYYPFEKLTNRFYKPYSSSSVNIINNSNTKIKGNTINVVKSSGRTNSCGIAVYGGALSAKNAKSYGLIQGKYFIENLEISKNTVNVKSNASSGIILSYLNNSTVYKNTVRDLTASSGNGLVFKHSQLNTVSSNIVNKFTNSIALSASSAGNLIRNNTLKNAFGFGIKADSTSSVKIEYGNIFKKNKGGAIQLKEKKFKPKEITVQNLKVSGKTVSWDKELKISGYKVFRSTKKTKGYVEIATIIGKKYTSFTDTTAEKGKKYYYKIAVFKSFNKTQINGAYSEYVQIKY